VGPVHAFNQIGKKKTDGNEESESDERQDDLWPYRCNEVLFHEFFSGYRVRFGSIFLKLSIRGFSHSQSAILYPPDTTLYRLESK
jgi:hypothetical protein